MIVPPPELEPELDPPEEEPLVPESSLVLPLLVPLAPLLLPPLLPPPLLPPPSPPPCAPGGSCDTPPHATGAIRNVARVTESVRRSIVVPPTNPVEAGPAEGSHAPPNDRMSAHMLQKSDKAHRKVVPS